MHACMRVVLSIHMFPPQNGVQAHGWTWKTEEKNVREILE